MHTIFSHATLHDTLPAISVITDGGHVVHTLQHALPLVFSTEQRFCVGWYDLEKRERHSCPENTVLNDPVYTECRDCKQRTGFNPAFYHATSVSPQQQQRNSEPHIVYLALFGTDTIKVGISHAQRNLQRLYEQGAWAALVLGTFADAHAARQHEATLAQLPMLCETVQMRQKIKILTTHTYSEQDAKRTLQMTKTHIEDTLEDSFDGATFHSLYPDYFSRAVSCTDAVDISDEKILVGDCVGVIGGVAVCTYQERTVLFNLKKYSGFAVSLQQTQATVSLPAQQMTLF